jgi:plastocyanin
VVALAVTSLALVSLTACGSSGTPGASAGIHDRATTVVTKLLSFSPHKLTVKAGTKVTWTDSDSIGHTVTTGMITVGSDDLRTSEHPDGLIDLPLRKGKDVSFSFDKPGTYVYYCSIHKGMSGEIEVTP